MQSSDLIITLIKYQNRTMKNSAINILVAFLLLIGFSGCEKEVSSLHHVYFYTNNSDYEAYRPTEEPLVINPLSLYINGNYHGRLPYLETKPTCSTNNLTDITYYLGLQSGNYQVEARDKNGLVMVSAEVRISDRRLSAQGGTGSIEALSSSQSNPNNANECVIVNLF